MTIRRTGYQPVTLYKSTDSTKLDANEDYSGGAVRFILPPDASQTYDLMDLALAIHDNDNDYNKFGNLSALTTGIRIVIEDANTLAELVDLTAGRQIKKTEDLFLIKSDIKPLADSSGATRGVRGHWAYPEPGIPIRGPQSERLAVLVPAVNFSSLEFLCFIAGIRVRNTMY